MHFVTIGGHTINLEQVCGIEWDDAGTATVGFSSGGSKLYTGEDAKAIADAVGKTKEDKKHAHDAPVVKSPVK